MISSSRGYLPTHNMRALIRDNSNLLPAISRFGIAFGFGDRPISQVCDQNNVHTATFLAVCNLLSGYHTNTDDISLPSLMGYLRSAHTYFLDLALPRIRHHLIEAINYSETNEAALLLIRFFDDYVIEVRRHMEHENDVIFSYVDSLLRGVRPAGFSISKYSADHDSMADKLNQLKDIFIYHYNQKDNARLSTTLFDIINCENDMISHFEVENRLLVPAVEALEISLQESTDSTLSDQHTDGPQSAASTLSEREKDIIRCVAEGLSNKEIADRLCISAHTVATHRRNIAAKLNIHSPAALVIFALINKLVDLDNINQNI